jgi:hypothetical protein
VAKNSHFFALACAGTVIALNRIDVRLNISYLNQGDTMTIYAAPGTAGAKIDYKAQYDNFIGGKWVAPVNGQYFDVLTPINGKNYTKAARSSAEDVELALDAAHAAADAWGKTAPAARANILLQIADRIDANLERLAYAETVDNGKPIRETLAADVPLSADHFRYFAGCLRAQEGALSDIDENTVAYHFHEPLGVVGQIIPWNFPLLMAAWKLAPAIGAGNCVVLKPAAGRPQHRQRLWPRSRHAAGQQQAHRQDRLHRLHRHRPRHRPGRRQQPDPGHPGTGRQVAERLLRRRDGQG